MDLRGLVRRGRAVGRRAARRALPPVRKAAWSARTVVPEGVRHRLHGVLPWRPGRTSVELDRIQLGVMGRLPAAEWAALTDDLLWPSTLLADGPHVALLRAFAAVDPAALSDEALLDTPYGAMARDGLRLQGRWFWATDEAGAAQVARDFLGRAAGAPEQAPRQHQSAAGSAVELAPIRWSEQYQVVDGHHRLAIAAVRGERSVPARVKWLPVTTPLQDTLNAMSWIGGEKELYQPIDAPELRDSWRTVRRCSDRLDKVLATAGSPGSYLDVACFFGWFVARMGDAGWAAEGVERDPLAAPVAAAVNGVGPDRFHVADAVDFLRDAAAQGRRWDVVSCFSLWHHFVLGRASVDGDELLRLLDGVTGRALYVDTGQGDEAWFTESLAGWTPPFIESKLRSVTTFGTVEDLGPDADKVAPYADNYGRHLFVCRRS